MGSVDALVTEHMGWARGLARKRASRHPAIDLDEMIGEALVALVEAAKRYDPDRGDFKSFAARRINGAMLDRARRDDPAGRHQREMDKAGIVTEASLRGVPTQVHGDAAELAEARYTRHLVFPSIPANQEAVADLMLTREAVAKLPANLRYAVERYHFDDVGLKQVGAELGVTESRVCQLINMARQVLTRGRDHGVEPFAREPDDRDEDPEAAWHRAA
jgi:RNA polymerase sigma factor for flagellar operon FliA